MGYKVNDEQVVAMSRFHPNKVIAQRLGISERQVSRILNKDEKYENTDRKQPMAPSELDRLMSIQRAVGISFERIAFSHGMSRQAVHQRLTAYKKTDAISGFIHKYLDLWIEHVEHQDIDERMKYHVDDFLDDLLDHYQLTQTEEEPTNE